MSDAHYEKRLVRHNGRTYEFGISWFGNRDHRPEVDEFIEGWGKGKIAAMEEHMPDVGDQK